MAKGEAGESDLVSHEGSAQQMPGELEIQVPGFRVNDPINKAIKQGKLGTIIEKLHDEGKHIVAKKHPGKIVLVVGASAALIGAIAGGIYLRRRKK